MSSAEIDIVVEAQVKHTESAEKIAAAISNLFGSAGELRTERDRVTFVSSDRGSLQRLKEQLRDRRVRSAARRLLLSGIEEKNQTVLLLNKQAAVAGIAAICDDPGESPLGPIVVRINSRDLVGVVEWLTKGYDSVSTT